jgi:hypothetical protein
MKRCRDEKKCEGCEMESKLNGYGNLRQSYASLSILILLSMTGCNGSYQSDLPDPTIKRVNTRYDRGILPLATNRAANESQNSGLWPAGWIPKGGREDRGRWKGIVIHHSATEWGNAREIDKWHKDRGWDGGGYHFVINNGNGEKNGKVEVGFRWPIQREGAHCNANKQNLNNYWNEHTVGICLVGNFEQRRPSNTQYDSLAKLISFLQQRYQIPTSKITTHGEVPGAITECPGKLFNWYEVQRRLGQRYVATK